MRILVTTNAAMGHFAPLVPTARALVASGHDVRIGCPATFAATVHDAGFIAFACREEPVPVSIPPAPPREAHDERLAWAVSQSWPSHARAWVSDLLAHSRVWVPDVVVVEPVEYAGRIVAADLDVPLVEHGWGFTLPRGLTQVGSESLSDLYTAIGASPVPPTLEVDLGASGVQDTDIPDVTRYRYQPWSHPGQAIPEPDGRQRIIVTLGTFDNPEAAGQIRLAAAAGQDAGAQVLAVLGNQDRRSIDDFRAGVHVLDWIDLPAAIATSDLVIHHGGAGTSLATLAAGRPAVVMPQMGDQFRNAALLQQSGVAITLGDIKLNPAALSEAIHTSLHDPDLTASARSLAAANHELPDTTELAERIVLLTTPDT